MRGCAINNVVYQMLKHFCDKNIICESFSILGAKHKDWEMELQHCFGVRNYKMLF